MNLETKLNITKKYLTLSNILCILRGNKKEKTWKRYGYQNTSLRDLISGISVGMRAGELGN